jgi:hypothetical protein
VYVSEPAVRGADDDESAEVLMLTAVRVSLEPVNACVAEIPPVARSVENVCPPRVEPVESRGVTVM